MYSGPSVYYIDDQVMRSCRQRGISKEHVFFGGEDANSFAKNFVSTLRSMGFIVANVSPMNRFQAMAQIMVMLTEEENFQQGSREYKIARKLVSRKIDRLGPETALLQVVDRRHRLMEQIKILMSLGDSGIKHPHLDF